MSAEIIPFVPRKPRPKPPEEDALLVRLQRVLVRLEERDARNGKPLEGAT